MRSAPRGHEALIVAFLQLSLSPTSTAPAEARARVADWLAGERAGGALVELARLLVSELATNCIRHATIAPEPPLRLSAALENGTLRLEMWDSGTEGTVAVATQPAADRTGGFGLELVERLSIAWGVERDEHGTTVWAELPATGATGAAPAAS